MVSDSESWKSGEETKHIQLHRVYDAHIYFNKEKTKTICEARKLSQYDHDTTTHSMPILFGVKLLFSPLIIININNFCMLFSKITSVADSHGILPM